MPHLSPLLQSCPVPLGPSRPQGSLCAHVCAVVHSARLVRLLVQDAEVRLTATDSLAPMPWFVLPASLLLFGVLASASQMDNPEGWWSRCPTGHALTNRRQEPSPFQTLTDSFGEKWSQAALWRCPRRLSLRCVWYKHATKIILLPSLPDSSRAFTPVFWDCDLSTFWGVSI